MDDEAAHLTRFLVECRVDGGDYGVVESRSWRMENDGDHGRGAVRGTVASLDIHAGSGPSSAESGVFIGEGGYEGLIAVFDSDYLEGNQGDAVILKLSVPPIPEMPELPVRVAPSGRIGNQWPVPVWDGPLRMPKSVGPILPDLAASAPVGSPFHSAGA